MSHSTDANPALIAALEAENAVQKCLEDNQSFILEAGAGAGKTYSLISALKHLIKTRGHALIRDRKRIACITYTNVAKNEIISRTDNHPAILADTIHGFCWSLIGGFQKQLNALLPSLPKWAERIAEQGTLENKPIHYALGYPSIKDDVVNIGHDDVLLLFAALIEEPRFRALMKSQYPIVFIDEYQDTDARITKALQDHLLGSPECPLIGFFGDPWQKIYKEGCGSLTHKSLTTISKQSNFRSVPTIVDALNRIRPDLQQHPKDPLASGLITVFHTNDWVGERRAGGHWAGDLPEDIAKQKLEEAKAKLSSYGWDLAEEHTKILMLTHNLLATEMGYSSLAACFSRTEAYIKKEDSRMAFFLDDLEPFCQAYENQEYGSMFAALNQRTPKIRKHTDKVSWTKDLDKLLELRATGTIGDVIDHLTSTERPKLPEAFDRYEKQRLHADKHGMPEDDTARRSIERHNKLRNVPYAEVIAVLHFVDDHTPYQTKHGVKGAQFPNVLIVEGRGWNHFNLNQFLEWSCTKVPTGKQATFERNRNLFYVCCSRPQQNLAILCTQELSDKAIKQLEEWFGPEAVQAI